MTALFVLRLVFLASLFLWILGASALALMEQDRMIP